jgi:hypothetical protein
MGCSLAYRMERALAKSLVKPKAKSALLIKAMYLREFDQGGAAFTLAQDFPLPGQFDPKKILGDILDEAVNRAGESLSAKPLISGRKA